MEPSEPILFFAARRGYYTDGVSFIVIVGLSPHEDKWYRVTERKLTERGISLGNFLLATVVSADVVKNFKLTNYSLEVKVEENIASVIIPTDKLVPCNDGSVGFRTKPFGIVISVDKNIKPGNYMIKITSSLSSSIKRSPLRAEVIPRSDPQDSNAYENYPQPASRTSSTKYTSVSTVTNKSIYETASVHSKVSEDDQYRPSNQTMSEAESIEDLIAKWPDLKPPMPLPRTVKPEEIQPPPIKNVVVGGGFAVKVPEDPKKQMIAFVTNVHIVETYRLHFLWICDIQEEAILRSPKYDLDKGHFFEGIFVCKIDKNFRLPANCVGRRITVERWRGDDNSYFCPFNGQNFDILESELSNNGVHLGDFLMANLTAQNKLKDFVRIRYPLDVKVENNFAIMTFASAAATRDSKGVLLFRTKDFGPVKSVNQALPLGNYEIVIKAADSITNYNITLCAEAIATAASPLVMNTPAVHNFYEIPTSKAKRDGIPNPANSYEYINSRTTSFNLEGQRSSTSYLELRNSSSTSESMSQIIEGLPKVHLTQDAPNPKPRNIFGVPKAEVNPLKPIRKIQKVQPNPIPASAVAPAARVAPIAVNAVEPPRKMKAFVHSALEHSPSSRFHFLWICDVQQDAVLKLPGYELSLGHFFEGVFQKQPSGQLECIEYVRAIPPFMKGSIVLGKVEITTPISNYQQSHAEFKYPCVTAKYLGTIIDQKYLLPPNCNGKLVTVQKRRLGQGKNFVWVITGLV
ncbi:hypothetical protein B9Z55_013507 [Caenorhabditis nigoni]|uniref:Uncharacterized protein n=1 Tax=Caenorhabditis nigoni TaxID=1611254 RepID=A0A2G5U237_9PELO|nr:hypothetical protein B9Z55_013507 [Caenorhabditis nigoni]